MVSVLYSWSYDYRRSDVSSDRSERGTSKGKKDFSQENVLWADAWGTFDATGRAGGLSDSWEGNRKDDRKNKR